jgi:serine/threonine protein kinase
MAAKKMIGRYQIKKELGRGGMATVYRAFDPMFAREVAIKVLPRELLHNPQFHKRFAREAKTIAKLEHAAIVPVYDVGEDNEQPYFVMRIMAGGSLAERVAKGPMTLEETASILKRIATGLDYAHKKGVVHRDLKPGNILFDEAGEPFLSDFGIAKIANMSQQTNLTGSGGIVGTAAYMSPEQARGEDIDYRSDIYALGIILYEMLSGKVPFDSNTPMGIAIKHITDPVPRIIDVKPDLPYTVQAVIDKALDKNPEARYPNAASFSDAFAVALKGESPDLSAAALSPTRAISKQPETRLPDLLPKKNTWQAFSPKMWLAGLGALALVGLVALAVSLFSRSQVAATPEETPTPIPETATVVPSATPPPSPTPEPEPVVPAIPGGADWAAFVTANDIWALDLLNNTAPVQLTTNRREKLLLQWLPNGEEILYREAGCLYTVGLDDKTQQQIICVRGSEIEGASVSPDGSQFAITLDRVLFILPFEREILVDLQDRAAVSRAATCSYNQVAARAVQWSADGQGMAISYVSLTGGGRKDVVRVLNISNCQTSSPVAMQDFPADIFTPDGYDTNPAITTFHWDGNALFLFNTFVRNDGYGQLYFYDMSSQQAQKLNPIDGVCCYRDARFSPDGTHIIFSFQDERDGLEARTKLFYIALEDALQGGENFMPLNLPVDLLRIAREKPMLVLRPAGELP